MCAAVLLGMAGLPAFGNQNLPHITETHDKVVMGAVTVDKIQKQVRIAVRTAIDQGILEYLLVEGCGKAYESAFKVEGSLPSETNAALLLLGSEPLDYMKLLELARSENGEKILRERHAASLLNISLLRDGKPLPLSNVLEDREGGQSGMLWVHTGGRFTRQGRFAGDLSLSHIAIWPDSTAVVNLFSCRGNPYRGEFGWQMNTKNAALKTDQEYELVITRWTGEPGAKRDSIREVGQ